jgi:hypothetical protein
MNIVQIKKVKKIKNDMQIQFFTFFFLREKDKNTKANLHKKKDNLGTEEKIANNRKTKDLKKKYTDKVKIITINSFYDCNKNVF